VEYKDYYATLGVPKDADEKAIKSAYRKLARQYHPDVHPNKKQAEARFKEINEAYEVLSDKEKRQKYDTLGSDWQQFQQQPGGQGGFDWSRYQAGPGGAYTRYSAEDLQDLFGGQAPFSDFFTFVFGGQGAEAGRARQVRGRDIEQELAVSLAEAFKGTVRRMKREGGPTVEVRIPAGVDTGTRLRVKGQGMPGRRGAAGDLWLVIRVEPDRRFERRGDDLHTKVAVPLYTALLGGTVVVPMLEGRANLKIPAETQNGTEMRMRGQGMPRPGEPSRRGDLFVTVEVRLPEQLTDKERSLLRELAGMRPEAR
jgi:curved DNA-binding protein